MDSGYLRIGEFSERVGVSADLLRAWERRYGLLRPERSSGGFRLYGDADVERVRRMREHLDGGLSAAQAARLALAAADGDAAPDRPGAPPIRQARASLEDALLDFDEVSAHDLLDRLLAGLPTETVLREAVMPVLAAIGDGWEAGEITVAQEHFSSSLLRGRLLALARGWGAGDGPAALLVTPPDEQHDLALVALGLALAARGWRITFLGADTPVDAIVDTCRRLAPDVLVLAATDPGRLLAVAADLRRLEVPTVAVGGPGATAEAAEALGALRLDTDPVSAADRLPVPSARG